MTVEEKDLEAFAEFMYNAGYNARDEEEIGNNVETLDEAVARWGRAHPQKQRPTDEYQADVQFEIDRFINEGGR